MDAPNQKLENLWSIPLPLERGELRVREWNRYIRKYRRSLKLVEDWNEASDIRHLLKDVLSGHWKRTVEDEEKKRAKKRVAVRIMASEDTHAEIMEFSSAKPRQAQPNVAVEEHHLRGGIRRHHGAKADAPQQRGVEARRATEDAGHLRPHEPGRDREVHHGGAEAQRQERGPRAGSTGPWTSRSSERSPTLRGPGGHLGFYGVKKSQNQLQSEILLFLSNYTIKSIFSGVSPPPPSKLGIFQPLDRQCRLDSI